MGKKETSDQRSNDLFGECDEERRQTQSLPTPRSRNADLALVQRIDRLARNLERIERQITISNEALALYVRFWLTATPPVPEAAEPVAQARGRKRYEAFVQALGRRLARGQTLARDITQDHSLPEAPPVAPSSP
jgi:hypothetical protein